MKVSAKEVSPNHVKVVILALLVLPWQRRYCLWSRSVLLVCH